MTTLPTVRLKPQRPERRGHPWVYDNEIASGPGAGFTDGGLVRVLDPKGRPAGTGYLNTRSKISLRYLTHDPREEVSEDFWRGRISRAYAYRQARYQAGGGLPPAYRLVYGEADGLPGLVVDVYGPFAVAQFLALGLEPWRDVLISGHCRGDGGAGRLRALGQRRPPPGGVGGADGGAVGRDAAGRAGVGG